MLKLATEELLKVVEGKIGNNPSIFKEIHGLSTDSRTISEGQCFLALKGENFDGHNFVMEAYKKNAAAIVVNRNYANDEILIPIIQTDCTLQALERIASYYYKKFHLLRIAITGSVGKTTSKHLACSLLSSRFNVLKSPKSFNNNIGVPLTLLEIEPEHQVLVMELGANAPGEIMPLSKMVKPDIGLITCIAPCHLEGFGSLAGVEQAKSELLLGMSKESVFITNADDPACRRIAQKFPGKVITFSCEQESNLQAKRIQRQENGISFEMEGDCYFSPLPGTHNIYNLLGAIAIAREAGMTREEIKTCIAGLSLPAMRMEVTEVKGITIINDAYNANPKSMSSALECLGQSKAKRKIGILGSMLELGKESPHFHYMIGQEAARQNLDFLFAVGKEAQDIAFGAKDSGMKEEKIFYFENNTNIEKVLLPLLKEGDSILLKASRRVKLEDFVTIITNYLSK